jgi:hypothetical protein
MKKYKTLVETKWDALRRLMLADGYTKDHASLKHLAKLRTLLKKAGYTFEPADNGELQSTEVN